MNVKNYKLREIIEVNREELEMLIKGLSIIYIQNCLLKKDRKNPEIINQEKLIDKLLTKRKDLLSLESKPDRETRN